MVDSDAFSIQTLTWENSKMNNINTLYFRDAITVASGEKTWMKTGSTHKRALINRTAIRTYRLDPGLTCELEPATCLPHHYSTKGKGEVTQQS